MSFSTKRLSRTGWPPLGVAVVALAAAAAISAASIATTAIAAASPASAHTSSYFQGAKVNGGSVTHATRDGQSLLTLSADFPPPDTPDPHWQVVDSQGNTYLLQRLMIKGDKLNRTIVVPAYVKDVQKVQIYCAWAEALLGEASFPSPVS